ncbi:MAG: hypothetical protein IJ358_01385 [Clostridia bacterium]|nr:hypothetical protein [Clostridia bacterium]
MERNEMNRKLIWDDASNACNFYAESLFSDLGKPELISKFYEENGIDVEIELQALICCHLSEKIDNLIPDMNNIREKFQKSIAKIPADLNVKVFKERENKLKTIAKLQYCIDRINSHEKMYDLIVADYLLIIYYKLSGLVIGQKHEHPTATFNTTSKSERLKNLGENRIFRYLHDSTFEYFNGCRNLSELFDYSIKNLVDTLFEQMVKFEHKLDKTVLEPWSYVNEENIPENFWKRMFVLDDDMDTEQEALAYAEYNFNLWLIDQMHTFEDGKIF